MKPTSFSEANDDWSGVRVLVLSPTPTHPQDFGNRKRIHALCSNLRKRGAQIVFVHYPAEAEWRSRNPEQAQTSMARAWDSFYTVPVTRDLHPDAVGDYHTIDEWWDEAIGDFLTWLFRVRTFDVFIVNYTWLSKAFEFAPASVTKILDTNDRFSGRKELLQRHGLRPEFFYTTEEEEAKGFARADLVWAIKDNEREHFERITSTRVLTLLHIDDETAHPRAPRDSEGYLRVGVIGARNSVNAANLRNFLDVAIPVFERYFAPIRLIVAGTVCSALESIDPRFVSVIGETAAVDGFYQAIDVACIPVAFSTGLKIKVAEALARRCPVVSLAHAFEGFPPRHPFHTIADFRELSEKLVELSFQPEMLDELAKASGRACKAIRRSIDACLRSTRQIVRRKQQTVLYCVDSSAFKETGCLGAVTASTCERLLEFGSLVVTAVSGPVAALTRTVPVMEGDVRVAVALEVIDGKHLPGKLRARGFEVAPFASLVSRFEPDIVVVDTAHPCLDSADFSGRTIVYRAAIAAQLFGAGVQDLQFAKTAQRRYVLGTRHSGDLGRLTKSGEAEVRLTPCFWGPKLPKARPAPPHRGKPLVAVLNSRTMVGSKMVIELVGRLGCEIVHVRPGAGVAPPGLSVREVSPSEFSDQLLEPLNPPPTFAVDISLGALDLQLPRELLDLLGVPTVTADCTIVQPGISGWSAPGRPRTVHELFTALVRAIRGDFRELSAPSSSRTESDADYSWLRTCMKLNRPVINVATPFQRAHLEQH